jgi:hypothetical protein
MDGRANPRGAAGGKPGPAFGPPLDGPVTEPNLLGLEGLW